MGLAKETRLDIYCGEQIQDTYLCLPLCRWRFKFGLQAVEVSGGGFKDCKA